MIVVLIDHHSARFFKSLPDNRVEETGHLEPLDPHGFRRHLEHRKEADYQGQRVPEAEEFYERVAERLKDASSILLLGGGTGKSSAMQYFLGYLTAHRKNIADHVVAADDVDLSSISLGDIEQIVRRQSHT